MMVMNDKILIILTSFLLLTGCTGKMPKLGVETGQLVQCPTKPNCVNSQAKDNEHFIEPILSTKTQLQTKEQLLKILNDIKRSEIKVIESDYIRAEFISMVFRFVDDVEFYFPETTSKEIIIHVRSASRIGHSDFGVNRKRIEEIRKKFKLSNG
ncbi:MAG: hypothetical protein ACJAS1_004309 [Oleiphilaceae bacterium]|jgi:uncharacterized protein (DUF1499 family)